MVDVEFPKDIYTSLKNLGGVIISTNDDTLEPAIEIVLHEAPRDSIIVKFVEKRVYHCKGSI